MQASDFSSSFLLGIPGGALTTDQNRWMIPIRSHRLRLLAVHLLLAHQRFLAPDPIMPDSQTHHLSRGKNHSQPFELQTQDEAEDVLNGGAKPLVEAIHNESLKKRPGDGAQYTTRLDLSNKYKSQAVCESKAWRDQQGETFPSRSSSEEESTISTPVQSAEQHCYHNQASTAQNLSEESAITGSVHSTECQPHHPNRFEDSVLSMVLKTQETANKEIRRLCQLKCTSTPDAQKVLSAILLALASDVLHSRRMCQAALEALHLWNTVPTTALKNCAAEDRGESRSIQTPCGHNLLPCMNGVSAGAFIQAASDLGVWTVSAHSETHLPSTNDTDEHVPESTDATEVDASNSGTSHNSSGLSNCREVDTVEDLNDEEYVQQLTAKKTRLLHIVAWRMVSFLHPVQYSAIFHRNNFLFLSLWDVG